MIDGIMNNSPMRTIKAKVELYNGSTLVTTYTYTDALIELDIERVGENKFFGFGICQKAIMKLRDINREINLIKGQSLKVYFGDSEYISAFPLFYIEEIKRDEKTGELTATAYDVIYRATAINAVDALNKKGFGSSYNVSEFILTCADAIGAKGILIQNVADITPFQLQYDNGANLEGTEKMRECLDAVAEITQTIYFINHEEKIVFKRLGAGAASYPITKSDYFELTSREDKVLTTIISVTELGDNVSATTGEEGLTQYVRNNPFWELREDVGTLVSNAVATIGGFVIHQFDLTWRGNYLLEIGDAISFELKDGGSVISYVIDDAIKYNGGYSQKTRWEYKENDTETHSNPATLGETLKETFAKVDKANKEITLLTSEAEGNKEAITTLQLNTESLTASVSKVSDLEDALNNTGEDISKLKQEVNSKITAEEATLIFSNEISNGVDKVETSTGFTFNEEGLTVSKSDSDLTTTITEDGMRIEQNEEDVLIANNSGVWAKDLHAHTYLIIGTYSRFEDYKVSGSNETRTGCFYLGG